MTKHTQDLWRASGQFITGTPEKMDGMLLILEGPDHTKPRAACWDSETRRRVVACVNVLRGVHTEVLEIIGGMPDRGARLSALIGALLYERDGDSSMLKRVIVKSPGLPAVSTTLAEFFADNDGLDGFEISEIIAAVKAGRSYAGGGGASPEWTIARAEG